MSSTNPPITAGDDPPRAFALDVVRRLRASGHEALWAGGCVRDQVLGARPKDYDVATSATPEQVRDVFGKKRSLPIGAAFGVITVLGPRRAGQIEVATFRTDGGYSDGRRPDGVLYSDAEHDALRRDFTINGLFYDPIAERVIDYVGGERDLAARVVRAIGDAEARIAEDKLRMLRAVRFAATLGFELDPATADAVARHAAEIGVVSAERVGAELSRMLTHAARARAVRLLSEVGLLPRVLPEAAALSSGELAQRLATLSRLQSLSLPLALAACLPRDARAPIGTGICRRLKLTNDDAKQTDWLLDRAGEIENADALPWPRVQRTLAAPLGAAALELVEAEAGGATRATTFCRGKLALPREEWDPAPLVDGRDLIAAGYRPGPEFGKLLDEVRDAQLDGRLTSKQEALGFARERSANR